MPIYEYKCENCGRVVEAFQKFSDDPLASCDCGGSLSKMMSLNSFHLKGSGWYVTDYAKGKGNQSTASGPASSDSATSDGAKDEKAEKTETKKAETKKTATED
jgi:putative FmdB family regulatory protein